MTICFAKQSAKPWSLLVTRSSKRLTRAAALDEVARRHHDLVLLDFDLPRMMGDETLERMLALRPGLVCCVLSGKDDLHQALLMGRHGAYGWIDKYVGTERLLALVAGIATRPRGFDFCAARDDLISRADRRSVSTTWPIVRNGAGRRTIVGTSRTVRGLDRIFGRRGGCHVRPSGTARSRIEPGDATRPGTNLGPGLVGCIGELLPRFADEPRSGWWHDLARDFIAHCLAANRWRVVPR